MLKSLNAWTVDSSVCLWRYVSPGAPRGFDGIELNVDEPERSSHSLTMPDAHLFAARNSRYLCRNWPKNCERFFLAVCGQNGFARREGSRVCEGVDSQATGMRVFAGRGRHSVRAGGQCPRIPYAQDWVQSLETLLSMRQEIEQIGLYVDVENVWNGFFTAPHAMVDFIDEIGSPYIGAYFDVGNVVAFSWPEAWIDALGARIHHVHVKDFKRNGAFEQRRRFCRPGRRRRQLERCDPRPAPCGFQGLSHGRSFQARKRTGLSPVLSERFSGDGRAPGL